MTLTPIASGPSGSSGSAGEPACGLPGSPAAGARAAAFFDVDGTLVETTIVHYYAYFRRRMMSPALAKMWWAFFLLKCLGYVVVDRINRSWFNVVFYRAYRTLPATQTLERAGDCYRDVMRPRLHTEGAEAIRGHIQEGRLVVLVTGSLDFLIRPLAEELGVAHVIAPGLRVRHGAFTGELTGPPIGEAEKGRRVQAFAREHGIDLRCSFAYGDSIADLPMLETVGNPVAVNPDRSLARVARRRGWPIERWSSAAGVESAGGAEAEVAAS